MFQVIWNQYTYSTFISFVAGWIGNDAVTPIIGEHDPYFHVYGRVSLHFLCYAAFMFT